MEIERFPREDSALLQIYRQIEALLAGLHAMLHAARKQEYEILDLKGCDKLIAGCEGLAEVCRLDVTYGRIPDTQWILQITEQLRQAQEQRDYIMFADLLEGSVQPFLTEILLCVSTQTDVVKETDFTQENIGYFEEDIKATDRLEQNTAHYTIETTEQGPLTLRVEREEESFYMHSNINPWEEALYWADVYEDKNASEYAVLGLGLGYPALELRNRSSRTVLVHVYEADAEVYGLAKRFQNFANNRNNNLRIHYDPQLQQLSEKLKEPGIRLAIHYPSLRNITDMELRHAFERYFVKESTERSQKKFLYANFNANIAFGAKPLEELRGKFAGRDVYIIAAGPSLDKNISLLNNRPENSVILAVGTVFHKLIQLKLIPDYVIITDANERVVWQVYPDRKEKIPLLILSTACFRLCKEYAGEKYIFFQKDFEPSEKYAAIHNSVLFETGGSVSTAALDIAIRFGAGRIIFLGLDLAFTNNLSHAVNTSNSVAADSADLLEVKGYYGGKVLSDYKFNIYAEWIEKRLLYDDAGSIPVFNATEGGRYIRGMRNVRLQEFIK